MGSDPFANMTKNEILKLTPEQKRIRIAEVCGWRRVNKQFEGRNGVNIGHNWQMPSGEKACSGGGCYGHGWAASWEGADFYLPDYLNDLNAMHAAEKALTDTQFGSYHYHVCHQVERTPGQRPFSTCATAAQRADAFLLAVDAPMGQNNQIQRTRLARTDTENH